MKKPAFNSTGEDNALQALTFLAVAITVLSLQDSLIKYLSSSFSFWQFQFLRSVCNIVLLVIMARFMGGFGQLYPKRARYVLLRGLLLAITMVFLFGASPSLKFSQMAAGLYTFPLFITLIAGIFLGERIGIWRISALLVGSLGAFILLDPLADGFHFVQVFPLMAGFFFACNLLTIRQLCRTESPLALTLGTGVVFLVMGACGMLALTIFPVSETMQNALPFLTQAWLPLGIAALLVLVISVLNVLGNMCYAKAYQSAESSILAPMDFCYLIIATFWGWVIFEEWPSGQGLIGMALIALSGVTITVRERLRQKSAK